MYEPTNHVMASSRQLVFNIYQSLAELSTTTLLLFASQRFVGVSPAVRRLKPCLVLIGYFPFQ